MQLNVVACPVCRFWEDGAVWSAPVCTSPAQLIWGSWEGWLTTAIGPHKHWKRPALADRWCCPIWLWGLRENVVGLGEGIVHHGSGLPVSRLIVGGKREWEEAEKRERLGRKKEEYSQPPECSGPIYFNRISPLPFPIKNPSLHPLSDGLSVLPSLLCRTAEWDAG